MPIASSSFVVGSSQADGRVWITETHALAGGGEARFTYLAADGANAQAVMDARVSPLAESLAEAEFDYWVQRDDIAGAIALAEQTNAQFAARMVARFHTAEHFEKARLCAWVLNLIARGIYTENAVRNAFGYDSGTWTTYKARMQTLSDEYADILTAGAD